MFPPTKGGRASSSSNGCSQCLSQVRLPCRKLQARSTRAPLLVRTRRGAVANFHETTSRLRMATNTVRLKFLPVVQLVSRLTTILTIHALRYSPPLHNCIFCPSTHISDLYNLSLCLSPSDFNLVLPLYCFILLSHTRSRFAPVPRSWLRSFFTVSKLIRSTVLLRRHS